MALDELEKNLDKVETTFNETTVRLESLARSLMSPPSLFLSRLLLSSMALGDKLPDDKAVCSGRALEFLDQALALGASASSETGYDEEKLLVTDYLYGQAIDQVVGAGETRIIDILAGAITGFAVDRVSEPDIAYRTRLIVAALEIALLLGEYDDATATAMRAAQAAAARGLVDWPTFIDRSTSTAAKN
ncbi:MAG: hypothetical protein Q8L35_07715 [Actinomycetota bacterium]|nr:hypothetical protein [Actinomycetota bacterium]